MLTTQETAAWPGDLRAHADVTTPDLGRTIVRMRTASRPWNREEFFAWLDLQIAARNDIKHMGNLAELAGMSHTTLSNWRRGVQRPTTERLSLLAPVLRVKPRDLWVRAGLIDAGDVGLDSDDREPSEPQPSDWAEELIMQSKLPQAAKDRLIEMRREQRRTEEEQLREQITVMESLQSE